MTAPGTPSAVAITPAAPVTPDPTKNQGPDKEAELRQKTAALAEERDKTRQLKEELEILKGAVSNPGFNNQAQHQPVDNGQRQLDELWESDPRRAMQTELQMALRWYDTTTTQVDSQADDVAKKYADFNTYRTDVNRYLRSLPLENRSKPGVIEAAYFYVKGQKADDLVNLSKEQLIQKIRMGEKVQGLEGTISGGRPVTPNPSAPTMDQANAASAMGMTIEEYMKHVR